MNNKKATIEDFEYTASRLIREAYQAGRQYESIYWMDKVEVIRAWIDGKKTTKKDVIMWIDNFLENERKKNWIA